ncbi:TPA: shufflon system plasmid conjugative transfer pilus tip adhesin PilV [Escherichia coli]|uniref:shufflon system plasmid conjugative transfer pilus tip adhesin PilV n=1 Tax=Escherichia coli TaxID=562 RepID=UPI00248C561C|nr:shufflon system plasmid conjugative transfer pilus tip adhesin PilV [Escherichia coli]MEB2483793.1 shufflon system plasmid conjugative transfer pilus tip adhesin PilV [Escherichia coli]
MKKFRHDDDKGFILLEILAGLIVIGIATPLIYSEIENWLNEQLYQSAASHADAYNTAARNYIADNNATLHNGSLPANFTADDLIRKGYLKQGFNRSPFGQSYITGIRRNQTTGRLEALTCSTGGQNIKEDGLRSVAGQLPGLGGYIGKNGTATGAFGAWTDKPGDYGLTCSAGHIAIVMMGDDLQESDRLYRFQVPGRPELNQMNTAINMGGNNLNNAGNVNGQSATLKGDVTSENGWLITKNDKGWKNITYGGGFTMTDSQWIRAVGGKGIITTGEIKGGKVSGGTVRSDGRLSTGEYLQLDKTAVANTKCSPDGLVGRTSTGAILSCQSGTWRKSNSGSTVITGRIANGQQIPLPTGFSASQCSWSVSNAENPQGWKPNYFAGSVATYDANRIVKCGFYDEYNFHKGTFRADLTGKCSYVVACQN